MLSLRADTLHPPEHALRAALAASAATGTPFTLTHFRHRERHPGLLRGHLHDIELARALTDADTQPSLHDTALSFSPRASSPPPTLTTHLSNTHNAPARILLALPALLRAPTHLTLHVHGTTHADHDAHEPCANTLTRAILPLLRHIGADLHAELHQHGFAPAGDGLVTLTARPHATHLQPLTLTAPLDLEATTRSAVALTANLDPNIAHRELHHVHTTLGWPRDILHHRDASPSLCPGNALTLNLHTPTHDLPFTTLGALGRPAETVAQLAINALHNHLATLTSVTRKVATHLTLPLAFAAGCDLLIPPPERALHTTLTVLRAFAPELDVRLDPIDGDDAHRRWRLTIT